MNDTITIEDVGQPLIEELERQLSANGAVCTRIPMSVTTLVEGQEPVTRPAPELWAGRIESSGVAGSYVIGWTWAVETRELTVTVHKSLYGPQIVHSLCRAKIAALQATVFDPAT
jgi:hypothetical protein